MDVGNVWGSCSRQIYATIHTCQSVSRCPGFNEICTVWPSIMTFTLQFFRASLSRLEMWREWVRHRRLASSRWTTSYRWSFIPSYCQWKWLNQYSCHLLIDQNSKLSLDKWATSVQHDPRRDGQRNKKLRGHPTVGVRKVKTWTWHENNSFPENPMSLSKCKESFAIISLRPRGVLFHDTNWLNPDTNMEQTTQPIQ